jgi:hypothetical protein
MRYADMEIVAFFPMHKCSVAWNEIMSSIFYNKLGVVVYIFDFVLHKQFMIRLRAYNPSTFALVFWP